MSTLVFRSVLQCIAVYCNVLQCVWDLEFGEEGVVDESETIEGALCRIPLRLIVPHL